jgi:DNA primase small subunit
MPHSVSPEAQPSEQTMADAEFDAEMPSSDADDQQDCEDHEMITGEASMKDEIIGSPKVEPKKEVNLEDLFADIDSDEEFPSSNAQGLEASSPPEAPASPM